LRTILWKRKCTTIKESKNKLWQRKKPRKGWKLSKNASRETADKRSIYLDQKTSQATRLTPLQMRFRKSWRQKLGPTFKKVEIRAMSLLNCCTELTGSSMQSISRLRFTNYKSQGKIC
jgi:hypothetical protein